jgi:outer membrane receptor for ferric coprogen and ferric-rhodotorulic acid
MRHYFRADLVSFGFLSIAAVIAQARAETVLIKMDLPAQALSESLGAVGRQFNINMLFDPAVVQGRTAPALQVSATVRQVLTMLLAGSGLEYRFVDERTIAVAPMRQSGAEGAKATHSGAEPARFARTMTLGESEPPSLTVAQTNEPPYAQNSVAAEPAARPANELGEVLVTARKMAENIQTVRCR